MSNIKTEAWVLYAANPQGRDNSPALRLEPLTIPNIEGDEVLVEPIYGCWEANMSHAVERQPVDICRQRGESSVVIGNSGVVRVLRAASPDSSLQEGDYCLLDANLYRDDQGYTIRVLGYDAPHTFGLLAKRTKVPECCLIPIPQESTFTLKEWAAFSVRYLTAWDNWKVAWACWRSQMADVPPENVHVWGWGGGVALAELDLAKREGCRTALIASSDERLSLIKNMGIQPVARGPFRDLCFEPGRYERDPDYRERYRAAEQTFLNTVEEATDGRMVSIFIDNIGLPVFRATLKAVSRQGVITTSGWKLGMKLSTLRALECIQRRIHVNTHGSRDVEARKAFEAAESMGWRPPVEDDSAYGWTEIPRLIEEYREGAITSYFPLFEVNPP